MQLPCAKTREFGEAEFSDCLPVSALVCVFAFDTGGLGLWLGAFGWSKLYRCQSVPGPPMPCFVAQSFQPPVHRASLLGLETHVLPIALCKSTRIRLVPNSWDSYAGFLWHRAFSLDTQSFFPPVHRAFTHRYTELSPSVHRASFWQPLQPWFVKETAFFFAKAQNLR